MNVYMTSDVYLKTWTMIEEMSTEIGGFGYAKLTDKGDLVWYETFLVPQFVSHSEVEFDGEALGAAVERGAKDGVLNQPDHVWVSWHSHHSMKPFWSKTDAECIQTYGKSGVKYLLSFVGCHDHASKARLDCFGVEHGGITIPQVTMDDLGCYVDGADAKFAAVYEEIEANIKKRPVKPQTVTKWAPPGSKTPVPGTKLADALEIRELVDQGVSLEDARAIVGDEDENGYFVGAGGLVHYGFDSMAWGD